MSVSQTDKQRLMVNARKKYPKSKIRPEQYNEEGDMVFMCFWANNHYHYTHIKKQTEKFLVDESDYGMAKTRYNVNRTTATAPRMEL